MKRLEVLSYLGQIKEAREEFARVQTKFASDVDAMMNRLIHEGARNFMSAEEIARAAGMPVKRIRAFMRSAGLSPSDSKTLLSKKAAEALANNSALLGIEPGEMDLMSPLAYLPMGSVMKRELQDRSVSQVTEVDEVSGNARAVFEFVSWMSAEYRVHSAKAVQEDKVVACARFGVEPEWFYDSPDEALDLRAEVAAYKIRHGL